MLGGIRRSFATMTLRRAALHLYLLVACQLAAANPFEGQTFYVNPEISKQFEPSIANATGLVRKNLMKMREVATAYWIDQKSKIWGSGDTKHVQGILEDAASRTPPEMVVLVWYDLPNRDCGAKASHGEICCARKPTGECDYRAQGDCQAGLQEYKSEYVDQFVTVLSQFEGKVPVAVVIEPDSLPNFVTNDNVHCNNATKNAYIQGVKYSVEQLYARAPSVSIYLDAAHGGWFGWEENLKGFVNLLFTLNLPFRHIRGFATNVANYQPLGVQCPWRPDHGFRNGYCLHGDNDPNNPCCQDPCGLIGQWNFGNNELNYAAGLVNAARQILYMDAHVIIDTGRNGVTNQRWDCTNWCNPRGSGAGVPSTTNTANISMVDAYFWLKTPGESDGCTDIQPNGKVCPRFDRKCMSADSIGADPDEPRAPAAGEWFDYQARQLAEKAAFEAASVEHPHVKLTMVDFLGERETSTETFTSTTIVTTATVTSVTQTTTHTTSPHPAKNGKCAKLGEQCGGELWRGATCCEGDCSCESNNHWYSTCRSPTPGGTCAAPTTKRTTTTTELPTTTTTTPVHKWAKMVALTSTPAPNFLEFIFNPFFGHKAEESKTAVPGPEAKEGSDGVILKDEVPQAPVAPSAATLGLAAPFLLVPLAFALGMVITKLSRGREGTPHRSYVQLNPLTDANVIEEEPTTFL